MGRPLRIQVAGITFHVVQRGHDRNRVFFSDDDYRRYLFRLRRVCQRYETSVHAYVLMSNHVHLLMTSNLPDGISRTMQDVAGAYSRRTNEQLQRTGSIWEGRYRSSPVDSDYYCLACYRYIELNPVRAGIVERPADYRWSSYRENVGQRALRIVEPHPSFIALHRSPAERVRCYDAIVRQALPDSTLSAIRVGSSRCAPVGTRRFVRRIEAQSGCDFAPRKRGRPASGDK